MDLPIGVAEPLDRGVDRILGIAGGHRVLRVADVADVPSLVGHDALERLAYARVRARERRVPSGARGVVAGRDEGLAFVVDVDVIAGGRRQQVRTGATALIGAEPSPSSGAFRKAWTGGRAVKVLRRSAGVWLKNIDGLRRALPASLISGYLLCGAGWMIGLFRRGFFTVWP